MENVDNFFQILNSVLGQDILIYFGKFYEYLSDLFREHNIQLENETKYDDFTTYKRNIERIFETVSLGLRTVGVQKDDLTSFRNDFLNLIKDKYENLDNYRLMVDLILKPMIESFLIEIIIQYFISADKTDIQNLDVFDFLPKGFLDKLENFRESHISPFIISFLKGEKIEEKPIPEKIVKIPVKISKPAEKTIIELLERIKQQRLVSERFFLKKAPIKEKDSVTEILNKIRKIRKEDLSLIGSLKPESSVTRVKEKRYSDIKMENIIEFYGNFPKLPTYIRDSIKVNIKNLSKYNIKEFQDLETFYYYICSLKMLGLDLPYSRKEIPKRLQNFISDKIFCVGNNSTPDPINVFYGTAIFSEYRLLSHKIIDIKKIKEFIHGELYDFLPWKLHLNLYSLLTLKILEKNGVSTQGYPQIKLILSKYNVKTAEDYYPNIDLFDKILSLKIIDDFIDSSETYQDYLKELKNNITSNGSINNTLTDTSKFLIMASLLNIYDEIKDEIEKMKNYLTEETTFFYNENGSNNLNWNTDNIGYKLEIRMLYWTLLALSQFPNI